MMYFDEAEQKRWWKSLSLLESSRVPLSAMPKACSD